MTWGEQPYYSLNYYLKNLYGEKVYKISINAGLTCPNRDGTIGSGGCIFCSEGGSGDFASNKSLSITNQINDGIQLIRNKYKGNKFIAYFQAFSNTYGDINYLRKIFFEAINHPNIVGISIATRPDCFSPEIYNLLNELNQIKKVWIELGLQTYHSDTSKLIKRGYALSVFEDAVHRLDNLKIDVIVHIILGLPFETYSQMLTTIKYINTIPIKGVKLQLLHVLKNTELAILYEKTNFHILSQCEYIDLLIDCIELLSPDIVIHRLTGDGPKKLLIQPQWSSNKKLVLNEINRSFKKRKTYQGKKMNTLVK